MHDLTTHDASPRDDGGGGSGSGDVLSRVPLFAYLDPEADAALRQMLSYAHIERGEVIFHEGDPGNTLYAVIDGKVKIYRSATDGRENVLSLMGPGEMFGELSLFDPGPRTSGALAASDCTLACLGHEQLRPWLVGRPELAAHLLQALAQRLRRTNDVLADLVFSDVPGRVAKALLDLAHRFGESTADGVQVNHELTQEELAQLVGASRETVNKALADFATRGWLRIAPRSVTVLDVEGLARRAK